LQYFEEKNTESVAASFTQKTTTYLGKKLHHLLTLLFGKQTIVPYSIATLENIYSNIRRVFDLKIVLPFVDHPRGNE
jgi:hypothetical protein